MLGALQRAVQFSVPADTACRRRDGVLALQRTPTLDQYCRGARSLAVRKRSAPRQFLILLVPGRG